MVDGFILFCWLVIGIGCTIGAAMITNAKRRGIGVGILLGFFLGIFGVIIAACLPTNKDAIEGEKLCPSCRSAVPEEATICKYCRTTLPDPQPPQYETDGVCSKCGYPLKKGIALCDKCGHITPKKREIDNEQED